MTKRILVIALDLDNTILYDPLTGTGSEEIKREAWFRVFPEYDVQELGLVLDNLNRGVSGGAGDRTDVIRGICQHFGVPTTNLEAEVVCRHALFTQIVKDAVVEAGIPQKTRDTLSWLAAKVGLYINTGTPIDAACEIVSELGLRPHFRAIYGRPRTKTENLFGILQEERIKPDRLLFVDDQESGHTAARQVGCQFVGIWTIGNTAWHGRTSFPIVRSIAELAAKL